LAELVVLNTLRSGTVLLKSVQWR